VLIGQGEKRRSRSHSLCIDQAVVDIVGQDLYSVPPAVVEKRNPDREFFCFLPLADYKVREATKLHRNY
jgi:hypothetical protein